MFLHLLNVYFFLFYTKRREGVITVGQPLVNIMKFTYVEKNFGFGLQF